MKKKEKLKNRGYVVGNGGNGFTISMEPIYPGGDSPSQKPILYASRVYASTFDWNTKTQDGPYTIYWDTSGGGHGMDIPVR